MSSTGSCSARSTALYAASTGPVPTAQCTLGIPSGPISFTVAVGMPRVPATTYITTRTPRTPPRELQAQSGNQRARRTFTRVHGHAARRHRRTTRAHCDPLAKRRKSQPGWWGGEAHLQVEKLPDLRRLVELV